MDGILLFFSLSLSHCCVRDGVVQVEGILQNFFFLTQLPFLPFTAQVLPEKAGIADIPEWFKGSRLNFAENLLRCQDNQQIALYATGTNLTRIHLHNPSSVSIMLVLNPHHPPPTLFFFR